MDWWVWLIIAIVVVLAIAAAAMAAKRGTKTKRRHEAESLRDEVRERDVGVQHKEAAAMEERASADEAQMRAAQLDDEAVRGREDMQEHLQKADRIDPDVDESGAGPEQPPPRT